ncbi:MAG: hypothetical protein A2667_02915 [Candidatus Wildermuthbacteria bacterium RIFCSPHIGHO2_01_FULL_47_27]|uniref:AB hydrolase-1 domain-containing protein n=2 Tax=Candidatus Wildermuthiibacteriota TaxID=1817923 RepID=A0A1G2RSK0_9BACT|nr:MAG: hypothetical protein UY15_C0004G0015 [Parcubacteria group bacterium GW2011_GWA2_47_9]OHA63347.1 MAG: hypothetical protein A2667_02915 [Candidatus Wildermuthbacteria bacterium RIFCSPHIGHO2_01_FULL_47_27]OHA66951.1 MAG: hypothetical protein A3D59_01860 [Candidatus Wildermuthbacteria bacterium RIFCSPHIGHO2_02_FULL_47_17]OHA75823.1 MAG: hypothetical protein A3A32_02045 [Candidatus Wildermuthbacteria bacterium RIFCSPLOWO2_01_FULL_48_35]OHA76547.1 MAG: hypothetical protein A3I38_03700 [Candid
MPDCQILILHGWGSSAKRWEAVKQFLEKMGCSVFVPDLPGFGESAEPECPWSVEDYAEWVGQWAEKYGLARFCLAGHSFGGGVAAVFAAKYPEKVDKLILIAAAIKRRKTIKRHIFLVIGKTGGWVFSLPLLSFLYPLFRKVLYKIIGVPDYLIAVSRSQVIKETFRKIVAEDLSLFLPRISAPTMLVWGDKDEATPLSDAHFIKQQLRNANLKIIQGAGHRLNFEAPEKVAEIIGEFLKTK